jgi:hypothetical protein
MVMAHPCHPCWRHRRSSCSSELGPSFHQRCRCPQMSMSFLKAVLEHLVRLSLSCVVTMFVVLGLCVPYAAHHLVCPVSVCRSRSRSCPPPWMLCRIDGLGLGRMLCHPRRGGSVAVDACWSSSPVVLRAAALSDSEEPCAVALMA